MAKPTQPVDEEESRLLAVAETCRSEEIAAFDLLIHPVQSLVYSEYKRLLEELKALRLKGHQNRIALKAHRQKMRDAVEGRI